MGTRVVIPKNELTEFDLPRVCVTTGATEGVGFFDVSFQYLPTGARIFAAFCGPLGYVIAMAFMRKTAAGKLPFVPDAHARWKRMKVVLPLVFVVALLAAVGVFAVGMEAGGGVSVLGLVVLPVVVIGGAVGMIHWLKVLGPLVVSIDDTDVTLELPSHAAARAFEERLHAPRDGEGQAEPRDDGRDALDDQIDAELNA